VTLFDIGAADVAVTSNDWYTPRWVFDAAGLVFDMDVAAPVVPEFRTCPARRYLTPVEDGLSTPWDGLVWMNPPYSSPGNWVGKFAVHHNGLALIGASRASWLGPLMQCADALALLTVAFLSPTRTGLGDYRDPVLLVGCGPVAVAAVGRVAAADKYVRGAYHVRPGVTGRAVWA
jgi:hypothetical protein